MAWDDEEDTTVYRVVVNHEEQYSIWPVDRDLPLGWRDAGKSGLKAECLAHIEEVWTDMRPLSLRRYMEEMARQPAPPPPADPEPAGESLVDRLASGTHRVTAGLHRDPSARALKDAIDRGYVHVRFPDTRGGTELGVRLDPRTSDWTRADFEAATGAVHLEGVLVLDYVKVRCIADIELASLDGQGRLEIVAD
jgi:uncharacterized protein YbdZ (MbtH family)